MVVWFSNYKNKAEGKGDEKEKRRNDVRKGYHQLKDSKMVTFKGFKILLNTVIVNGKNRINISTHKQTQWGAWGI